ncbi:MAG: pyridoxal phosphate-dependent aminotransferase [Prevotella sp.]|nr:pyridoxal phosphate-dependent aminotransferase [Prevotella sp.]
MTEYDFGEIIPRHGTSSMKYDSFGDKDDIIEMWVADMDFRAAPPIIEALRRRVQHGIFGYNTIPDSYFEAVQSWFLRRHNFAIEKEWIMPAPGVVAALSCVIKALTQPGDAVLFHTPAYNCFFSSVRNNGCRAELSPLIPKDNSYVIDFEDFERRCARPDVKMFVLCNPHNPTGRVWTRNELARMADICFRNNIIIVADEIHCDIIMPGHKHIPFATVDITPESRITLVSPSKGFNIAGLQIANIICDNALWRRKIDRAINDNEVCDLNPFGIVALQAAYNESEPWLDAMCKYIHGNYLAMKAFFEKELPALGVCRLEGTYLAWVDVNRLPIKAEELSELILNKGRVRINDGRMYGDPEPQQHIRINLACPRPILLEALQRMSAVMKNL